MAMKFLSALALCLVSSTHVHAKLADVSCDDRSRMITTLKDVLGAERQGMGLRDPETMLEVWVTRRNGNWLIVQNYANGTACIVAMGEHWDDRQGGPA